MAAGREDWLDLWKNLPADPAVEEAPAEVVALDYGVKRNILRLLAGSGCKVTVVPAKTTAAEVLAQLERELSA